MVVQVIKLPFVAADNFQPRPSTAALEVSNASSQNNQENRTQATALTGQAAQNIEVVSDAANVLNEFAGSIQTNLNFSVDEDSGRSVITVTDTQTGDIIRQIPAKEVLAVANLIRESAGIEVGKVGLLLAAQG